MNEGRVAKRYAEAFRLSQRSADAHELYDAVRNFISIYEQVEPDARRVMANALVTDREKIHFLQAFTMRYCPKLNALAELVVKRGRGEFFLRILYEIERQYCLQLGIVHALVESAVPLDDSTLQDLHDMLAGRVDNNGVRLSTRVVPELIGGFRISVGDRLLDRSVQGELRALARGLLQR